METWSGIHETGRILTARDQRVFSATKTDSLFNVWQTNRLSPICSSPTFSCLMDYLCTLFTPTSCRRLRTQRRFPSRPSCHWLLQPLRDTSGRIECKSPPGPSSDRGCRRRRHWRFLRAATKNKEMKSLVTQRM